MEVYLKKKSEIIIPKGQHKENSLLAIGFGEWQLGANMKHDIDMAKLGCPGVLARGVIQYIEARFISLEVFQSNTRCNQTHEIIKRILRSGRIVENVVVEFLFTVLISIGIEDTDFILGILGQFVQFQQ